MKNLKNNVTLIGRLGKTPEVKHLENNNCVARLSIATTDVYKDAKGNKKEETQWHNIVAWGKTAQLVEKLLDKGDQIVVQGKLSSRSYEDKSGATRYITEIVVNEFLLLNKPQTASILEG